MFQTNNFRTISYDPRRLMKLTIAMVLSIGAPAVAAAIAPTNASKHVGETVIVEGKVSVYRTRSGVTFVDLGGAGRDAPFTGVIFKGAATTFPNITNYSGKTADIIGTVRLYCSSRKSS
jgi:hypothetical protein